jgi:hypothetical protein
LVVDLGLARGGSPYRHDCFVWRGRTWCVGRSDIKDGGARHQRKEEG